MGGRHALGDIVVGSPFHRAEPFFLGHLRGGRQNHLHCGGFLHQSGEAAVAVMPEHAARRIQGFIRDPGCLKRLAVAQGQMPGDVAQEQRVIRGHRVQFGKREMPLFGNGGIVIPRAEQPFPGGHTRKGFAYLAADVAVRPHVPDGMGIHVEIVFVVHARAHEMAVAVVEARHHEPPAEIDDAGFRALERGHFGFRAHGKDGFAGYGKAGNDGAAGSHRQDGAVPVDVSRLLHGWPHKGCGIRRRWRRGTSSIPSRAG